MNGHATESRAAWAVIVAATLASGLAAELREVPNAQEHEQSLNLLADSLRNRSQPASQPPRP